MKNHEVLKIKHRLEWGGWYNLFHTVIPKLFLTCCVSCLVKCRRKPVMTATVNKEIAQKSHHVWSDKTRNTISRDGLVHPVDTHNAVLCSDILCLLLLYSLTYAILNIFQEAWKIDLYFLLFLNTEKAEVVEGHTLIQQRRIANSSNRNRFPWHSIQNAKISLENSM